MYQYNSRQMIARSIWLDKIMSIPDSKLSPSTKIVVSALSYDFATRGVAHTEMIKIWVPNLSDYSGLCRKTVGQHLDYLSQIGAIIKERRPERRADGVTITRVWITFVAQFYPDIQLVLPDRPQRKERQRISIRCPHCGEYHNLQQRALYFCTGCSSQIEELIEIKEIENRAPGAEELARLDRDVAAIEKCGADVAMIPDEAIDEFGSAEATLNASPIEIARVIEAREELANEASEHTKGWYAIWEESEE